MASNKLFEAAAEILAQSKSAAPAMPSQKLDGETVDLGGPTPQDSKPTDDSNKIDTTKAAKKAVAPTTKPSDASAKMEETESEEEIIAEKMHDDEKKEMMKSHKPNVTMKMRSDNTGYCWLRNHTDKPLMAPKMRVAMPMLANPSL